MGLKCITKKQTRLNTTPKTKDCIRKIYNEIANKVGN